MILESKKKILEILAVTVILGLVVLLSDYMKTSYKFDGVIERNAPGEGSDSQDLTVEFYDDKQELTIEVSDKKLPPKEINKAFKKAIKEIDKTYLGTNTSPDNITSDMELRNTYLDGLIEAEWKFDEYGVIGTDGKLREDNIPEEGMLVNVQGILRYEQEESIYSFCVFVKRKGLETLEGQLAAINKAVREEDEKTRNKNSLILPKEAEGIGLTWKRKMNYRGLQIIVLGFAAVAALTVGQRRDKEKARKQLIQEKERDYPTIVSQLSILMGAGMSFRKALERIVGKYLNEIKKGKPSRPGFEEMVTTYRRMTDGLGEIQALEELGKHCDCKEYRKLSMMLIQNLRKGSKDLLDALEKEEKYVFEMRKQRALRAGEEASTKLLMPMAGMLGIVIIILVVPAIMQMNI